MKISLIIVFIIISNSLSLFSNQNIDSSKIANDYFTKAVQSINTGKFDDAIILCDSAILFNSTQIAYPYEKALAIYKKNRFTDAAHLLDSLTSHPEVNPQIYQLLGNCYDAMDSSDKAMEIYNNGLQKFPKSGRLRFDIGLYYFAQNETRNALNSWESGIYNEPKFSNNYYILTKYYYRAGFTAWSVLYGELFSNLTDNDFKAKEVSSLLYEIYKRSFYHVKDSIVSIQFTTSSIISPIKRPNKDLVFDMAFQSVMQDAAKGILPADSLNFSIDVIYQIQKKFIELWYAENLDKTFPNVLFDWHKKMIDEDIFEPYIYFLFREGAKEESKNWVTNNQLKMKRFQSLIPENLLKIDETHCLYKSQYH